MRKTTLAAIAAFVLSPLAFQPASAQGTITTPPGTPVSYYFDNLKYDLNGVFGLAYESHKEKQIYVDGNDYYIPNFIWVGAPIPQTYVKGTLQGDTIFVPNHQLVYSGSNSNTHGYLCWLDDNELPGDTINNVAYDEPIKFIVDGNTLYTPDDQMILTMVDDTIKYSYGFSALPTFTVKDSVDKNLKKYNMSCVYTTDNNNDTTSIVTVDDQGGIVYLKGLDVKYPDTWFLAAKEDNGDLRVPSGQIANTTDYFDTWMYAANANAKLFVPSNSFTLAYDADKNQYATPDSAAIYNIGLNDETGQLETYQTWTKLVLTETQLASVQPAAPTVNLSQVFRVDSRNNPNFVFKMPAVDVDGNAIDQTALTYRIYINGELYTFTKADYPQLEQDKLTDIPYSYDDYYNISKSGSTYYITFRNLTKDQIQTIGVELVYTVNGQENVSKRLVYNVANNTVDGINAVRTGNLNPSDSFRFNLNGQRVGNSFKGLFIQNGKKYIAR